MSMAAAREPQFMVVESDEGRRSLWPAERQLPAGWRPGGFIAARDACLAEIERMAASGNFASPEAVRAHGSTRVAAPTVARSTSIESSRPARTIDFGLTFFGDTEGTDAANKYQLILECARFADRHGFTGLWLPERHFTQFGCLSPAPAVLHAAIARETTQLRLRAGSVVMPLNDPIRVAEEWAVVDNLSGGRVELSFASGWHADDFALAPEAYEGRYEAMFAGIEAVRRLWRGERIARRNGRGQLIEVRTFPTPISRELPCWLTAAGNPSTFQRAGAVGAGVFTHLFDQQVDQLAAKIAVYREAREAAGLDPAKGRVAVVLHSFVAATLDDVRRSAERAYCDYLKSNLNLLGSLALSRGVDINVAELSPVQLDEMVAYMFEKFLGGRSLLGTPESCAATVAALADAGVSEVVCLLDFGPEDQAIIDHLPLLDELRRGFARVSD